VIKETLIASLIYGGSTGAVTTVTQQAARTSPAVRYSVAAGIAAVLVVADRRVEPRDRKWVRVMVGGMAVAIITGHLSRRR